MRNGQQKRMRGRPNNRRGSNPLTRVYESNGPDVKVRGTAHHIAEKYQQLARDAQSSSDPVAAENYLQHAEHYLRLIASLQGQFAPPAGYGREEDGDEDEGLDDVSAYDAPQPYMREQGGSDRPDREGRDNRAGREPRESREPRDNREHREPREPREPRESREPREGGRSYRDNREGRDNRDRDNRNNRDRDRDRDNRDHRDNREQDNRSSNFRRPRHEEDGEFVAPVPVPVPVAPVAAPAPVVREPVAEVAAPEVAPAPRARAPRAPRAPRAETRVSERPETEDQIGLPSFITGAPVVAPAPRAAKAAPPVAEEQDDNLEGGEARTGRRRRRYRSRLDQADETSGGEDAPEATQGALASE